MVAEVRHRSLFAEGLQKVIGFRGGLLDLRGEQIVVVGGRTAGFHGGGELKSAVHRVEADVVAVAGAGAAHRADAADNPHPQRLAVAQYSCILAHFDMEPPRCMDSARAKSSGNKLTLEWSDLVSQKIRLESRSQNRCEEVLECCWWRWGLPWLYRAVI